MVAEIGTLISGISNSIAIVKAIKDADTAFDEADTKFKLAELLTNLAESQVAMADIKLAMIDKDEIILNLKKKLQASVEIVFQDGAYYAKSKNDQATGRAYCSSCWDKDRELVHIVQENSGWNSRVCPVCRTSYGRQNFRLDIGETVPSEEL
jgi:hypothetical protein